MNEFQRSLLAIVASAVVMACFIGSHLWARAIGNQSVVTCASGCGGAPPTLAQEGDLAAWTADDGMCIQNGQTKGAIDACRDAMRRYFCGDGGMLADSGGCAHVFLSTGVRP